MQESIPVGAPEGRPLDPGSSTSTGASGSALDDPRALQILSTEHWSLLAGRSLAYNEAFSRAGMFLTFLSATLIVIGFVIGSQGLVPGVVPLAATLLLADLYIGAATVGRSIDANSEELFAVRGMNRIRLAPSSQGSAHEDPRPTGAPGGGLGDPLEPGGLEHRREAHIRKGDVQAGALGVDGVGLQRRSALRCGVVDGRVE